MKVTPATKMKNAALPILSNPSKLTSSNALNLEPINLKEFTPSRIQALATSDASKFKVISKDDILNGVPHGGVGNNPEESGLNEMLKNAHKNKRVRNEPIISRLGHLDSYSPIRS
eukprot:6546730-Pyramimonas_sp.AAC.1